MNIGQLVIDGLVAGAMYAIMASGLSLVWGTVGILNFAHGEFYMIGGYALYFTLVELNANPLLAVIAAVLVTFGIGAFVEMGVLRWLLNRREWELPTLVATLGLSVFLQNLALRSFGATDKSVPYLFHSVYHVGRVTIASQRVAIVAVAVIAFALLWGAMRFTRFGIGLRATAQDRDAATLMGIDVKKIYLLAFAISAALAALAATMLSPIFSINPGMGARPLLKAIVVVVLGGMGASEGAIIGGFGLGISESIGVALVSSEWEDVIAFGLLILTLWLKPSGLFGTREA